MIERIAHITDLHLDESFPFNDQISARKRFDAVLKSIERENITQIVCTGDIGENDGVQYFFEKIKTKDISIALGNHDTFNQMSTYYTIGVNHDSKKIYSSIVKTYYKYIYLDSSAGSIDDKQLFWLKEELISSKPIIIFVHHPIIGLNLKVDEIGKLENRDQVIAILKTVKNTITIYCGHYHLESTLNEENITQYITPAVSFQIKKDVNTIEIETTVSGYRIIEITKDSITSQVKYITYAN
ncbi:metallophosphoesterase family protein [Aquimarina algicola]|uniref:Calcineurin-like phosphoesterase domain-containing protein n=1 Tax=Aquimarina algicola TaxID=2589995 RepID=A0A504JB16_9FLAO|nr:metallophosphoesterase [Aquimarina algicola]TPN83471.1 hypothetical protein FHK87_19835 [Aquimarina algicola]